MKWLCQSVVGSNADTIGLPVGLRVRNASVQQVIQQTVKIENKRPASRPRQPGATQSHLVMTEASSYSGFDPE